MGFVKSNEDHTREISQSVFVANFPESTQSGDLWKVCSTYGTVIDVFIPNKRSKSGKRFAFVRYIKVFNLVRLVENLCTIWIGRYNLYANQVRFERPRKSNFSSQKVGLQVYLKSISNSEIVANGWIRSLDPDEVVGSEEIGPNSCQVDI
uniref:RNA-directed DNA polymerase, eukaryota, nucleotide-binding alpha-beta plait domain protein n=1 Tax=Tanacetum cinerariifolium TaxID=118510 RepID=A0A6L2KUP8_TANCI|nr:RNA-directed DNA polymerase, eukaryota, nucleotide-binding alpha-beta plait domain protein [Tanacetum cinerariifolium]